MTRIPSISLLEVLILAGCAGLVLLIGAVIVAVIVIRRKQSSAQLNDSSTNGNNKSERTAANKQELRSQGLRKWIAILVLLALFVLPLLVVVGGVLWVAPFRSTRTGVHEFVGPTLQVVEVQATPAATLLPNATAPGAASTDTPQLTLAPTDNTRSNFGLNPFSKPALLVLLPGIAGLVLLLGAAAVAPISKRWRRSDPQLNDTGMNGDNGGNRSRMAKLRYGLLGFAFWLALSVFFILDLSGSVSLYFRFVAIYVALWVLVGALLLYDRPRREKLLILGLFVIVLFSVRFIDWNSRKPFLKDFYSIKEGMTVTQVKRIMGNYRIGGGTLLLLMVKKLSSTNRERL